MQSKMTPGPWSAFNSTGKNMQSYSQSSGVVNKDGKQIVCGCFSDIGGEDVAAANAKAIAVVPDLIEATQDAIESLSRLPDVDGAYRVTAIQQLKNALKKAGF